MDGDERVSNMDEIYPGSTNVTLGVPSNLLRSGRSKSQVPNSRHYASRRELTERVCTCESQPHPCRQQVDDRDRNVKAHPRAPDRDGVTSTPVPDLRCSLIHIRGTPPSAWSSLPPKGMTGGHQPFDSSFFGPQETATNAGFV
jgi:hypothetical protein